MTKKMIRQMNNKELAEWQEKEGVDSELKQLLKTEADRRYKRWAKKQKGNK